MYRSDFWGFFHQVWGKDSARELGPEYDKKAWMYVQSKIEQYEKDRIAQDQASYKSTA